jgi:hypothetical protein
MNVSKIKLLLLVWFKTTYLEIWYSGYVCHGFRKVANHRLLFFHCACTHTLLVCSNLKLILKIVIQKLLNMLHMASEWNIYSSVPSFSIYVGCNWCIYKSESPGKWTVEPLKCNTVSP